MWFIALFLVLGAVIAPGCGSGRALPATDGGAAGGGAADGGAAGGGTAGGGTAGGGGSCTAGGTGGTGGEPPLGDPFQTIEYEPVRPPPYASVRAIAAMASGDVVVGGDFSGDLDVDPGPGVDLRVVGSPGNSERFVSRLRADGVARWTRTFAGTRLVESSVAADASGAVIVSGVFNGAGDVDPYDCGDPGTTGRPAQVIKFSPEGHRLWSWMLGEASSAEVAVAPDGKVVVYGEFRDALDFDPGPAADIRTPSAPSRQDAFIVELDSDGRLARPAWTFGGSGVDTIDHVQIGADGSWYVAGTFTEGVDLDPGPGELRPTLTGTMAPFGGYLLALNADRKLRWAGNYPDPVTITALAIGADGLFVAGTFDNGYDLDPGPGEDRRPVDGNIASFLGGFLGALDLDGRQRWVRTWGSSAGTNMGGVVLLADGSPVVCSDFLGALAVDGQRFTDNPSASLVFLIAFQPMGDTRWIRVFGLGAVEGMSNWVTCAGGLARAPDGTLLVAGAASGRFTIPFSGTIDAPVRALTGYVARLSLPP